MHFTRSPLWHLKAVVVVAQQLSTDYYRSGNAIQIQHQVFEYIHLFLLLLHSNDLFYK